MIGLNNLKRNKMTVVEWLVYALDLPPNNYLIEEAKEMEKQQQDDFAIGFAEWLIKRETKYFESLKELLEIYKKEKGL